MERLSKIKDRVRNFNCGIWFLLIFLISLGLCVYIPRYMIGGTFKVGANVNYADETMYFTVEWKKFLQIICLGPVFGIIYYTLMRVMLGKVDKTKGRNKYSVYLIEIGVVTFIALCSMAHLSHLGFEEVNLIDQTHGAVLSGPYQEQAVNAWYMDEWLGHTLIMFSYFMYLCLAVLAESLISDHRKMKVEQIVIVFIGAIGIAFLDGEVAFASECGFFLLVSHIIFTIIAVVFVIVKKIKLIEHPILLAMILSIIPLVYFNIVYIIENGIYSMYPFYSGNLS